MELINIFYSLLFLSFVNAAHIPEVYEDGQKNDNEKGVPQFDFKEYQKQLQQHNDPLKVRYQQQQAVDQQQSHRDMKQMHFMDNVDVEVTPKIPTQTWKIVHPKFVHENQKNDSPNGTDEKAKIIKKSLPAINENARQDFGQNYIYVNDEQKVLQQNLGGFVIDNNQHEDQLKALNSLIGQNPNAQLQGLQQLLNDKDHTPIREEVADIPNGQTQPNIKVEHSQSIKDVLQNTQTSPDSLNSLQAQLDFTAKSHAESILAQAQQKAFEHVKAQHEALAQAQADAEQRAIEQIHAQNEAYARAQAEADAEEEHARRLQAQEDKEKDEKRKANERRKNIEHARERARIAAANYKKQQQERENTDAHTVVQKTRANTQKKLRKVPKIRHETKPSETHHITQIVPIARAPPTQTHHEIHYQPIVQHPTYNTELPIHTDAGVHTKFYNPPEPILQEGLKLHDTDELEYAANYAFGYRIHNEGNDFGHNESKDGVTTKGHYHVRLPDGRVQNVEYYVDPSGYHAKVSYDGVAQPIH